MAQRASLLTGPFMRPTSHDARGTAHRRDGRVDGRCLRGVAPPALSPKTPSYDSVAIGIGSGELSRARPAPTTHRGSSTRCCRQAAALRRGGLMALTPVCALGLW